MCAVPRNARRGRPGPAPAIPPAFLARMSHLLGAEYGAFAATYDAPPRAGLRLNPLKVSPAAFAGLAPVALEPLPWPPAAYLVADEAQPGKHPYHAAGLYYLQDPSAMVPAALLAPQPGERVLDLAAAPGGKATHLAGLLAGQGLLVANDIHPQRVWDLAENLERWGARNAVVMRETPERLAEVFHGFFDRVLVDAPCSGEGMLRKSAAARLEWAPELVQGCALRQDAILDRAASMLRPGGVLAYATCTFAPEEDEGAVSRFLAVHPAFRLLEPPAHPGFAPGRPDWLPAELRHPDLARAVRLWPHRFPGEGQFVALLYKAETPAEEPAGAARRAARAAHHAPRPAYRAPARPQYDQFIAFCRANLAGIPAEAGLAVQGSYLYQVPPDLPDLGGLAAIHPGWWLGSFKKDRFEPSHALALALRPAEAQRTLDLDPNGPDALAYLRGETLRSAGDDGWTLVSVGGFALGWGKRVGGSLKSHYPRGLRRY